MDPRFNEENLNLFTGFIHKYDPDFSVDLELIQPILHQLFNCWACQDTMMYEKILNFFSDMWVEPGHKAGVAM